MAYLVPNDQPMVKFTNSQVVTALTVSLGSLIIGYSAGYTGSALPTMMDHNYTSFKVTKDQSSWVSGIMPLTALVGGIIGGPMIDLIGRRNTIIATAIPFFIGWMLIGYAFNIIMIFTGRSICGFCVGVNSLALPIYLGETLQPEVRGTLGLFPTVVGNFGILLVYLAGYYMNWSQLAFVGSGLPVPFLILMFMVPESPRWYIAHQRKEKARNALVWLRSDNADIDRELNELIRTQQKINLETHKNVIVELMCVYMKPISISIGLMFFQQFSGINAVIYYAVDIFNDAGSTIDSHLCSVITGIVNLTATLFATGLIDQLGRKLVLYFSDLAMIATLFMLTALFYWKSLQIDISQLGWLPLAIVVTYIFGFSLGFGPIPWLMMAEILPAKIRGPAASCVTAFNWLCTFIVTKTFHNMIDSMGTDETFLVFCIICIMGLLFILIFVPETSGKSLEEIERKMMGN